MSAVRAFPTKVWDGPYLRILEACLRIRYEFLVSETPLQEQEKHGNSGIYHIAFPGVGVSIPSKDSRDGRSDMSVHDFLTLVVTAALIVLSAAVHSPFAVKLVPVLGSGHAVTQQQPPQLD
jgi:hypothetical protein